MSEKLKLQFDFQRIWDERPWQIGDGSDKACSEHYFKRGVGLGYHYTSLEGEKVVRKLFHKFNSFFMKVTQYKAIILNL